MRIESVWKVEDCLFRALKKCESSQYSRLPVMSEIRCAIIEAREALIAEYHSDKNEAFEEVKKIQ